VAYGKGTRWAGNDLGEQYTRVTGDMLLAAATVSYAGVFTAAFRKEITRDWTKVLQEECITVTCSAVSSVAATGG